MQSRLTHPRSYVTQRLRHPTFVLFLIVLGFYLYTLAPSVNWADGARMQSDVMLGGSTYWFYEEARHIPTDGLPFDHLGVAAWDHPLFVMLGRLFIALPWGEPPQRINLMSAISGALAIALTYKLGKLLVSDHWAAALGALALAVSHTFWFNAVTSEVFTLNVVFMITMIWVALRWPYDRQWRQLAVFALAAGLGLANHLMLGLTMLLAVLYMIATTVTTADDTTGARALFSPKRYVVLVEAIRGWRGIALVGLFILGFAPWWIQFVRAARIVDMSLILKAAIGFPWVGKRLTIPSWWAVIRSLAHYLGWLIYQFTFIGVALGFYGCLHMRREQPRTAGFLLAIFASHVLLWANYFVPDQFNYHIASYVPVALLITWGIARLRRKLETHLLSERRWLKSGLHGLLLTMIICVPITLYAITPSVLRQIGVTESIVGIQPIGTGFRDVFTYFLNPNKRNDDSAARFGRSTLAQLAPDALVFTPQISAIDQEAYAVLRYFQLVEKLRPDVRLELLLFEPSSDNMPQAVLEKARKEIGCRPLYLASLNPDAYPLVALQTEFEILPEANLHRLLPRQPKPVPSACPEPDWTGMSAEELIMKAMRWE